MVARWRGGSGARDWEDFGDPWEHDAAADTTDPNRSWTDLASPSGGTSSPIGLAGVGTTGIGAGIQCAAFMLPWLTVTLSTGGFIRWLVTLVSGRILDLLPPSVRELVEGVAGQATEQARTFVNQIARQIGGTVTADWDIVFAPTGYAIASGISISLAGTPLEMLSSSPFVIVAARWYLWALPATALLAVVAVGALWFMGRSLIGGAASALLTLVGAVVLGMFWNETRSLPSQVPFVMTISYGMGFWLAVSGICLSLIGSIVSGFGSDGPGSSDPPSARGPYSYEPATAGASSWESDSPTML